MYRLYGSILALVFVLMLAGCSKETIYVSSEETVTTLAETVSTEEVREERFACHVCGAVASPGVYYVEAGAIKQEAIHLAGGFTDEAATAYINLAEPVLESEKIYVPTEDELDAGVVPAEGQAEAKASDGKIRLNTATKEDLTSLPGIGDKKASAILSYRESIGGFTSTEQIMEVDGIKAGTYEAIKDMIAID